MDGDENIDLKVHGATSLDLLRLELELRRRTGLAVSLETIEGPVDLAAILEAVEQAPANESEQTMSAPESETSPATAAQAGQWLAERMRPDHLGYLLPIVVRLPGSTSWSRLSKAVRGIVRRHPALRTKVEPAGSDPTLLRQVVLPPPGIVVVEPRSIPNLDDDSISLLIEGLGGSAPSVSTGRPWRAMGLQVDGSLCALLLLVHHAVVDDPSIRILVRDLHRGLDGEGIPIDEDGGDGHRDLLEIGRLESEAVDSVEDLDWWRDRLAGVPGRLPLPGTAASGDRNRRRTAFLDASTVASIDAKLIEKGGVRSALVLQAARGALRSIGIDDDGDLPIGVPVSLRDHPSLDGTVGMLLNTLPIPVARDESLGDIASSIRDCRRRRRVQYERIARELPGGDPVIPGRSRWLDLVVGTIETDRGAPTPLDHRIAPTGESPFPLLVIARFENDGCRIEFDVDPAWITDAQADAFIASLEHGIRSVTRAEETEGRSSTVSGPRLRIQPAPLHEFVSRSAKRTPHAIAVEEGSIHLDYAGLRSRMNGLAHAVLAAAGSPGDAIGRPIGIMGEPGRHLCTSVLAAMRAGGEAMPISADTPATRIASIIERARPAVMIVMKERERRLMEEAIAIAGRDVPVLVADVEPESDVPIPFDVDPKQGCYLLFTSGSTGDPRAVRMHHAGLAGLIEHECARIGSSSAARTAQFAPIGFDVSFQEMFTTWATGGTLVTVPTGTRRDPHALARFLEDGAIARLHIPPLMLRALSIACRAGLPRSLREIICAGEALRIDDEVRRAASGSHVRLLNQYGPTETHVVTQHDLGRHPSAWPDLPPIGVPIDGVEIRIESPDGGEVPFGGIGELVVQGDAVARGYLDGDSGGFIETADGVRRYRTGDRARLDDDGVIEYLGRLDDQVKISGYRVDPREIEVALVALESVDDAAVIAVPREDLRDGHDLVAFVVGPSNERDLEVCIDALRGTLPPWLVPARIRSMEDLPRSVNGKVDRLALQEQTSTRPFAGHGHGSGWTAGDVLNRLEGEPPIHEEESPLGALGIDSLGAIRVQEGLSGRFGLELPIAVILESNLGDLRDRLRSGPGASESLRLHSTPAGGSSPPAETADELWRPLDPLVRDVLAEDALAPEGAFHLAWTIDFPRDIPPEEIGRRLAMVRRRYETLRTCRTPELGERVLDVGDAVPIDLESFPEPPLPEERTRILRHPLRLAEGMPWRAATWSDPGGGRILLVVIHHAAVDGRTARLILDEIVSGDTEAAVEENKRSSAGPNEADEQWWVDRVRATIGDEPLPVLDFDDADRRSTATDPHGGDLFRLSAEEAARHGLPPITPALLAWAIVLGRASGRTKVVIGLPFATELDEAGLGASILPVGVGVGDTITIADALAEVAGTVAGGLDHRGATLGRIVRRIATDTAFMRPPLDGVITRDDVERRFEGALIRWTSTGAGVFRAGLVVPSTDEGVSTAIDVESSVLDGEVPADLLDRVMATLGEITMRLHDSESGSSTLGDLDCLTPGQRLHNRAFGIGDDFDEAEADGTASIPVRFESIVADHADLVAVIDRDESISYRQLDEWSASIAAELAARCGSIQDRGVVVAGPRSAATIASMLGVVRAGGWFVPMDPDIPGDQRTRQLESCRPVAMLASDGVAGIEEEIVTLDPHVLRDGSGAALPETRITGGSAFYAMFTSGTTGEPRGASIPNRAVHRLIDDAWFLPEENGFRMLHAAPLAFDASTLEIWWPLLNGGTVCCWEGSAADLPGLHARMTRDRVRGCWLTAALFHAAVDGLPELFSEVEVVLTGGDVVSPDHVRRLHAMRPDLAIVDGYGPTENTVFTACESIVPGGLPRGSVPIGRPVRGTRLRIVDPTGHDVPPGRFGELLAAGSGVGLGYLGADGRPEDRDGYRRDPGRDEPVYRTGDRVRWRVDGRLEFGGRFDHQVKIAGRRIEPGAIESSLRRIEGILDACVVIIDSQSRRTIEALLVLADDVVDIPARLERIRSISSGLLPAWEVPGRFEVADAIPTTRNGKPDRREVERILLESRGANPVEVVEPRQDELLAIVCDAIASVSGTSEVHPDRSIRDLGIDSLDLLRLAIELENRVARPVRLVDVLEGGSAAAITARIADDIDREDAEMVGLHPGSSTRSRTLYCIPGVGGTVFSYQSIIDRLPSWLPVQGLPYPGTAGRSDPLKRVEIIGERFADRIRTHGGPPIAMLGYSLGGFVAFEAARHLLEHDVRCPVIVVDSAPAGLPSRRSFAARVTSASDWKMRFRNVLPAGIIDRLGGGGDRALQSLRGVVAAGFEAMRFYAPTPAPIDVVLVRTTQTDFGPVADIPDLGWSEIARRVDVIEIPTAHLEVFRGGSMDLARAVRFVVERRRDER